MALSKGEIDRLGDKIRTEETLSENTLNELQSYRTSYKDALSSIFTLLCLNTQKIHPSAIVTYRIKRFESIIGKLKRYPDMRFNRMWDIGGCRCIVRDNSDVYKLKELISSEPEIEIIKEYNYIEKPQESGYKSLHLFVKCKDQEKVIEVQLRSKVDHNWATLVEITDVLFDSKLKESGSDGELFRFHVLLSKIDILDIDEKKEIAKTIKKYNYIKRLNSVFTRNYIKVRRQWFDIESQNHKYFLIETTKEEVPKIQSFKSSNEAEEQYFTVYKTTQTANIVLTHLQTPNYNQISIAYSNYILTYHSFLTDCYSILESLIMEALEKQEILAFYKVLSLYTDLLADHLSSVVTEVEEVQSYMQVKGKKKRDRKKLTEWMSDIQEQGTEGSQRANEFGEKLKQHMPRGFLTKILVAFITRNLGGKYDAKTKKLLSKI